MKNLGLFIILVLTSCTPGITVQTDYDRDVNIKQYTTYGWADNKDMEAKNNPLYYNELNDKRIKTTVEDELAKKGYVLTTQNPELILHYHLLAEKQNELRTDPYGVYGPYWIQPHVNSYYYTEGTIIIDIMEAKTNNLAWRGWATSIIDNNRELNEAVMKEAIQFIFKEYHFKAPKN